MSVTRVLATPELLCQIFEDCLPDIIFLRNTPLDAPLLLTQVSRTWREIAISNGRLWTSFELKCKKHTFAADGDNADVFPALSEWLRRSGQRPFSLKVTYDADELRSCGWTDRMPVNASVNKLLLRNMNRWKELDIGLPSSSVIIFHNAQIPPSFPQLKKLTMHDDIHAVSRNIRIGEVPALETLWLSGEEDVSIFLFNRYIPPSVRHLSLMSMSLEMHEIHSTGITRLSLYDTLIFLDDFAKFPDFFPNLEVLDVSLPDDLLGEGITGTVVLHNLHTLSTETDKFPMTYMTAPKLKYLFIKKNMYNDEPTDNLQFTDVLSFLAQSRPPLQVIEIHGMEIAHEEFIALLDMVPSLEDLAIVDSNISVASLKALVFSVRVESSEATTLRCPGLRALHLESVTCQNPPDTDPSFLIELIRALLVTRVLTDSSVKKLEYIGLPLRMDELELLQWERHVLSTVICSTLLDSQTRYAITVQFVPLAFLLTLNILPV